MSWRSARVLNLLMVSSCKFGLGSSLEVVVGTG